MSSYLGGGRPPENVWVEPEAHSRSAGRPSHIKSFAPIGTRSHEVRVIHLQLHA